MFFDVYCKLCHEKGISPTGAALEMGISRGAVSAWKNGARIPNSAILTKIAAYFGVSVDYLLGNEEKPAAPKDSELDELVKDELVGFYGDVKKELTPGDIEDIKTLMKIRAELNRQKGK